MVATDVAAATVQPTLSRDTDKDCKDGNGDTIDWCDPSDQCKHPYRRKCEDEGSDCDNNKDCSDGDSKTKEWCYRSTCHYADRYTGECMD